jgi:hypothetical protein
MSWINWILSFFWKAPVVLDEVKPLIKEGEEILQDLSDIVKNLRDSNYFGAVAEGQSLVNNVQEFVAELEKVVEKLRSEE